jgi:replicative DNA helicase
MWSNKLTKSGAAGGSLRGQRANWIYLDEVDYMTDDDFDTIFAIALEAPSRIGVWASSTPTGRRGMFYRLCNEKDMGWTEFYHPSTVNPEWDATMEKELRAMFSTEVAWQHEVLAEFGEETIGVFKKEYIDRAKIPYDYYAEATHMAYRCAGVDWDLKVRCEFISQA